MTPRNTSTTSEAAISRPAVSEHRLSLTAGGHVRYQLKTPYADGTTHVLFEPLDFLARLAARVPTPRVNRTRYHGVFAPNSAHRAWVTKSRRGKGARGQAAAETDDRTPPERRAAMTSAQRLKRVFKIHIETCSGRADPKDKQGGRALYPSYTLIEGPCPRTHGQHTVGEDATTLESPGPSCGFSRARKKTAPEGAVLLETWGTQAPRRRAA